MASVVIYNYLGDKFNAKSLRHFGFAQLEILRNAMRFQGLKQNKRIVEFTSGINVTCTSVFGVDTVNIYVPPLLPVLKKDIIVIEEYCWCSHYFTEGEIFAVLNPTEEEGTYFKNNEYFVIPYTYWPNYEDSYAAKCYYGDVNITSLKNKNRDRYTGIMYIVKVCRGLTKRFLTCTAIDSTLYSVGDTVVLYCVGDYLLVNTVSERVCKDYVACTVLAGNCFSCKAILNTTNKFISVDEVYKLDGTYSIVSLKRDAGVLPEQGENNVFYSVPSNILESNCIIDASISLPSFDEDMYGHYWESYTPSVDLINNTAKVTTPEGVFNNIPVHYNCQLSYGYKDRIIPFCVRSYLIGAPLVLYSGLGAPHSSDNLLIIGFTHGMPVRRFTKVAKFTVQWYYNSTEHYEVTLLWDLDNDCVLPLFNQTGVRVSSSFVSGVPGEATVGYTFSSVSLSDGSPKTTRAIERDIAGNTGITLKRMKTYSSNYSFTPKEYEWKYEAVEDDSGCPSGSIMDTAGYRIIDVKPKDANTNIGQVLLANYTGNEQTLNVQKSQFYKTGAIFYPKPVGLDIDEALYPDIFLTSIIYKQTTTGKCDGDYSLTYEGTLQTHEADESILGSYNVEYSWSQDYGNDSYGDVIGSGFGYYYNYPSGHPVFDGRNSVFHAGSHILTSISEHWAYHISWAQYAEWDEKYEDYGSAYRDNLIYGDFIADVSLYKKENYSSLSTLEDHEHITSGGLIDGMKETIINFLSNHEARQLALHGSNTSAGDIITTFHIGYAVPHTNKVI